MTTENAGVIEIDPPLVDEEIDYLRRVAEGARPGCVPWRVSRDGSTLRVRMTPDVQTALDSLRLLIGSMAVPSRFLGTVALYDADTRELVALTASNGRVTLRSLRKGPDAAPTSNVIDLAGRRRRSGRRAIG